jgi:hypothetical protein
MARHARAIAGGFAVMLLASGPAFLAVGLSAKLHGRTAVAWSALAFLAGSLLASGVATRLEGRRLPAPVLWPGLGAVVAGGWILAPAGIFGLIVAQFVAGMALPALEGTIDSAVAGREHGGRVTAGLAWSGASRALGTAAAVSVAPTLFDEVGVSTACLAMAVVCGASALVGSVVFGARVTKLQRGNTARSPATRVTGALRSK